MSGEKRYFLDTNALVAFGNGEESIGKLLSSADAVATFCESVLLTRDDQLLKSGFCETLKF